MTKIEFKYERTEGNTALQLSGKLRGLRPLNKSDIFPTLHDNILELEVRNLDRTFFVSNTTRSGWVDTSREYAFDALKETFGQTDVHVTMETSDGATTKLIISADSALEWIGDKSKLIVSVPVRPGPSSNE